MAPAPGSTCPFVFLDFTGYSTWGFGARLQVRADGTALLEGALRDEQPWQGAGAPEPRRVGHVPADTLAAVCTLLQGDAIAALGERHVQQNIYDGPTLLLDIHTANEVRRVYEYGTEGPALLHVLQQRLDNVVRDTPWEVWNGAEADWLTSTGWMPLEAWRSTLVRDYPPWATDEGAGDG